MNKIRFIMNKKSSRIINNMWAEMFNRIFSGISKFNFSKWRSFFGIKKSYNEKPGTEKNIDCLGYFCRKGFVNLIKFK